MQFTTNVQLLLDGLNTVTRALSARPTKQILEGVHLSAAGEHVKLTCSDGNLSIEMSILADVKEEGTAVLPGHLLKPGDLHAAALAAEPALHKHNTKLGSSRIQLVFDPGNVVGVGNEQCGRAEGLNEIAQI